MDDPRLIDTLVSVEGFEVPTDIGWGIVTFHKDGTLTRTCKGCGVSVTSRVTEERSPLNPRAHKVESKPFQHGPGCPVWDELRRL